MSSIAAAGGHVSSRSGHEKELFTGLSHIWSEGDAVTLPASVNHGETLKAFNSRKMPGTKRCERPEIVAAAFSGQVCDRVIDDSLRAP